MGDIKAESTLKGQLEASLRAKGIDPMRVLDDAAAGGHHIQTLVTGSPTGKSLVSKLAEVMDALHRVPKAGRNEFHGYNYATESDIVEVVRGELAKRHIMLVPSITAHDRFPIGNKDQTVTMLTVIFRFIDGETGERLEQVWMGYGADNGDKGIYKAMTGATKYALLKTFLIPTGDDPETEKAEKPSQARPVPVRAATAVPPSRTPAAPAGPATGPSGEVYVRRVDERPTKKPGVTRYEVTLSTGEVASTIKDATAHLLKKALADETPVTVTTKETKWGKDIDAVSVHGLPVTSAIVQARAARADIPDWVNEPEHSVLRRAAAIRPDP